MHVSCVHVYTYAYVCMFVYIAVHVCTDIYTYMWYTYIIRIYIFVCVHPCVPNRYPLPPVSVFRLGSIPPSGVYACIYICMYVCMYRHINDTHILYTYIIYTDGSTIIGDTSTHASKCVRVCQIATPPPLYLGPAWFLRATCVQGERTGGAADSYTRLTWYIHMYMYMCI